MASSGTYNFTLANADIVLEAFDRCEIRPSAITAEHMVSAKRSLNLELQRWSNLGVNLWAVDLITQDLQQGVLTYTLPQETVSLLDVYLRLVPPTTTVNVTPNISITVASTTVRIAYNNHGLSVGSIINLTIPVGVGNILLFGSYTVISVIDANTFTIVSPVAATSTVSSGGAVPVFTATTPPPVGGSNLDFSNKANSQFLYYLLDDWLM